MPHGRSPQESAPEEIPQQDSSPDLLQGLEQELDQLKRELRNDQSEAPLDRLLDALLQKLTRLTVLTAHERSERLGHHPEVVEALQELADNVQQAPHKLPEKISRVHEVLAEEKQLLLSLMYSILADLGRTQRSQEVIALATDMSSQRSRTADLVKRAA